MNKIKKFVFFIFNNMDKLTPQELVILGTSIALELARCKTKEEIKALRFLVGQIYTTLITLYF